MRIVIASVSVPFLTGGAEALAEGLRRAIAARGHPVDIVTLPFRFFPHEEVERAMRVWEGEDFTRMNLYEPDRVVCLKFPAYGLKHPAKALWLCHQHRGAYELFDEGAADAGGRALREAVERFDARHLAQARPRCTISRRVSERMKTANGIDSTALYHPPPMADAHHAAGAQPYVFFPSRFEEAKRQALLVRAMAEVRAPGHAVFAGEGGQSGAVRELAERLGVADRVRFLGRVGSEELLALYASATAICFPPRDEDYGYVTLEAMLSSKPVITCTDSGGPLEFVVDGETG
ncbi:MAG TPA: glycosyltransferase family 4 protein, partial [Usitatibacter sp.]|nr:glycosyltransferase family 4 protein [Usitatibacter sp.]